LLAIVRTSQPASERIASVRTHISSCWNRETQFRDVRCRRMTPTSVPLIRARRPQARASSNTRAALATVASTRGGPVSGTFDKRGIDPPRELTPQTFREFTQVYKERHVLAKGLALSRSRPWIRACVRAKCWRFALATSTGSASSLCSGGRLDRTKVPLRKCPAGAGLQVALEMSGL
jgi:hypothetical protein